MFNKFLIVLGFCACFFVLSGCAFDDDPLPKIVPVTNHAGPQPVIKKSHGKIPRNWVPKSKVERKWSAIILHHSLTDMGNMKSFDNYHRNGHRWKGIGYNFVIGNGNGSRDGKVEVTFRWRDQITGAHCGGTRKNWANERGIGICLVGDFSKAGPTRKQMQSLVKLTKFLQQRYGIPKKRIFGHRDAPGYTGGTKCPANFPMARFKAMLDF